jgi:hypothetical protein
MRILWGFVSAEIDDTSAHADLRAPLLSTAIKRDALEPGGIGRPNARIAVVLAGTGEAQIGPTVIKAIAVFMID